MSSFLSSFLRPPQSQPLPTPAPAPSISTTSPQRQQQQQQYQQGVVNGYPINNENRTTDPLILWESLYNDGYCILPGAVSKTEIDNALREINRSMGRHVPNRQDMCPDCKNHPAITDLFNKSSLKGVLNTLLGDYGTVGGGQIALRFPGDHTGENYEIPQNWTYSWHIDGLGDYNDKQKSALFGDINNFSALVGVVLQDAEEEYMGNLTVYPGSHYQLQNYFRVYGFEDLYLKGVQGLPQLDFTATRPIQIRARAGDAIILNYSTAHNIAPNVSPFIRYTVYFRLTKRITRPLQQAAQSSINSSLSSLPSPTTMKHRPDSMLNVWSDWSGLQRMPFYQVNNPFQVVMAVERNPTSPSAPKNSIQQQQQQQKLQNNQQQQVRRVEDEDEEMRQLAMVLERSKYDK